MSPGAALISLLSLWMISTGVFLDAPTPFQAAWDVLEVVEHDQERLTCQRPRSDLGPDLIHHSALANTTLTLLSDSILPYLLDHHELLADIRVAIERHHPLIALKFTEVLIKRCIDLPKHSQQLIVHEVHAQPIAPFGIPIIRKNQVTGSNGVSTSSVKLHPKVHAHRWFALILMKIYSQGTILNIPMRILHFDPLIGRPVQARPNMDTIRNVRRSIHGLDRHLVTAHFGLVLGKIDQADRTRAAGWREVVPRAAELPR